jgi:hypothetical protein
MCSSVDPTNLTYGINVMNIIAYGSLMDLNSLETTLGRPATLTKISVRGVRRVFNAPFGRYAFLNLQTDQTSFIEAAYFTLAPLELRKFNRREAGSVLQVLQPGYFAFVWPQSISEELPVLQSYLNICTTAAAKLAINMSIGLIKPKVILNDTINPLYKIT